MDSDERERELREALERARIAFKAAKPEERDAAEERFRVALDEFTRLVMPRPRRSKSAGGSEPHGAPEED